MNIRRGLVAFALLFGLLLSIPCVAAGEDFKSLGFGLALGFRWNVLSPDLVDEAHVDPSGIVRVDKRVNTTAGFMLESHCLPSAWRSEEFGTGPFVMVQPGTNPLITSIGLGWMFAWKLSDTSKAFGLGLGYSAQPSAKVLGEEFEDGKPAPLGPDGRPLPVRFETVDKGSVVAVLSFVF